MSQIFKEKTALIVDDSEVVQKDLSEKLSQLGLKILGTALNGEEGLKKWKEMKPDLTCLDIIMGHMHGLDCYKEIKKIDKASKCIFISALANDKLTQNKLQEAFPKEIFLSKPVSPDDLAKALHKIFEVESEQVTKIS